MTCLAAVLLSGATAPQGCNQQSFGNIGPSTGEIVGAAVGVVAVVVIGTVVLVEVHNSHHIVKGCVLAGPSGLQVQDMNNTHLYNVTGVTTGVKIGDVVRLHGNKQKKVKGEPDQGFVIQKIDKDYGACKVTPAPAGVTPAAPAP
jgi:hypothetical protein